MIGDIAMEMREKDSGEQSLGALRDEIAMLCAEQILPSHAQLAEMDAAGLSIKKVLSASADMCYEFSDFMLAARNK